MPNFVVDTLQLVDATVKPYTVTAWSDVAAAGDYRPIACGAKVALEPLRRERSLPIWPEGCGSSRTASAARSGHPLRTFGWDPRGIGSGHWASWLN